MKISCIGSSPRSACIEHSVYSKYSLETSLAASWTTFTRVSSAFCTRAKADIFFRSNDHRTHLRDILVYVKQSIRFRGRSEADSRDLSSIRGASNDPEFSWKTKGKSWKSIRVAEESKIYMNKLSCGNKYILVSRSNVCKHAAFLT